MTTVDVTGLKDLSKALKAAANGTDKRLRTGLKGAGAIVAAQAKANATWSTKIPGSISVSVTQKAVSIVAKGGEAVSYEMSGKHPVFGRGWNRVPLKRPFLKPAAVSKADDVASAILEAIADISL